MAEESEKAHLSPKTRPSPGRRQAQQMVTQLCRRRCVGGAWKVASPPVPNMGACHPRQLSPALDILPLQNLSHSRPDSRLALQGASMKHATASAKIIMSRAYRVACDHPITDRAFASRTRQGPSSAFRNCGSSSGDAKPTRFKLEHFEHDPLPSSLRDNPFGLQILLPTPSLSERIS